MKLTIILSIYLLSCFRRSPYYIEFVKVEKLTPWFEKHDMVPGSPECKWSKTAKQYIGEDKPDTELIGSGNLDLLDKPANHFGTPGLLALSARATGFFLVDCVGSIKGRIAILGSRSAYA